MEIRLRTVERIQEERVVVWVGQLNGQHLLAALGGVQDHLNAEEVVVVLSIGAALDSHDLLVVVENLIEFEVSIEFVVLLDRCRIDSHLGQSL